MKKFPLISLTIAITLLFTIAFQAMHAFEHSHHHDENTTEIALHLKKIQEKHHHHEKCFVCEFAFTNAALPQMQTFTTIRFIDITKQPKTTLPEKISTFSGTLPSHRGPPSC